ncbi:MAG: carbamate kinase [Actinomycetota bacterium]|nr:carbamate kinase [Actinomycetota bacterium]
MSNTSGGSTGTLGPIGGLTVVALGGNALLRKGERGTAAEQRANLAATFRTIAPLLGAAPLVITHGNGPQVGNELLRQELAAAEAPPLPLYLAVAQTQAEIGALIAAELPAASGRDAVVVLTRVAVDPDDDAFRRPTKPVGPFYDKTRARELERERGWTLAEDSGRGWRRVVPSPRPREVLELESIRALVAAGAVPVAAGGGGIPVVRRAGRLDGVDAVIDKDLASALLATGLGADRLLILTQVPAVYRGFGNSRRQEPIAELRPGRDDELLATLPAGSMRPKVEAAFAFVRATGGEATITSADALRNGEAGTRIVPAS